MSDEAARTSVPVSTAPPKPRAKALTRQQLARFVTACAPTSPPGLIRSIVLTESGGYPLRMATNGAVRRIYSPEDATAAAETLAQLAAQGANVDIGLMQLNSATLAHLHVAPAEALDPCRNIALGAQVFDRAYATAFARRSQLPALWSAASIYNTGDPVRGVRSGYAGRIQARLRITANTAG